MSRVLFAGAGAEVDMGFPGGIAFINDTFYRKKERLYDALREFYEGRMGNEGSLILPFRYHPDFLFGQSGGAYKTLISNILRDDRQFLEGVLKKSLLGKTSSDLTNADLSTLYEALIIENDSSDEVLKQQVMLKAIPDHAHYGVLESYYSDLLHPNEHPYRFWKLINFYWSAFFSVLLPATDYLYRGEEEYCVDRYNFVLRNLSKVIDEVFKSERVKAFVSERKCYYSMLAGGFDQVITTNYTPYSSYVIGCNSNAMARLSGCLSWFEDLATLEFSSYEAREKEAQTGNFVFPYLMCQSPVKPIISSNQIGEYSKACSFLRNADELVVLGYSFCDEDSHIASMVASALRANPSLKLVYFSHCEDEGNGDSVEKRRGVLDYVSARLRLAEREAERLEIRLVADCESPEFQDLVKR